MNFLDYPNIDKENMSNDQVDLENLILAIESDLYNIAKNKIYNVHDVEDILQETIIKIYNNFDTLKDINSFKSWATSILLNECIKTLRKKYKDELLYEKMKNQTIDNYSEYDITNLESDLCFIELLNTTSDVEQNIFILRYKCNYSIKEIATILNINENTIKSKLKRIKEKIENEYNIDGGIINEE